MKNKTRIQKDLAIWETKSEKKCNAVVLSELQSVAPGLGQKTVNYIKRNDLAGSNFFSK